MHLFKAIGLGGLAASVALAETDSMCGDAPTVYVTLTVDQATYTTMTIYATTTVSASLLQLSPVSSNADTQSLLVAPTDIAGTSTTFETMTNVLSLVQAPAAVSSKSNQGPFSFAEHSGTTIWLGGKTPQASQSVVHLTKAITVVPVLSGADVSDGAAPTTTSFTTVSLTKTTSEIFTETLTESPPTLVASARPFTGHGAYGWNSSSTSLLKVPAAAKGSDQVQPTTQPANLDESTASLIGTGTLAAATYATGNASDNLAERQVGAIITATIGGIVVSWTNSYDGHLETATNEPMQSSATIANAIAPTTPTTSLGAYPWDLPTPSSAVQSTESVIPTIFSPAQSSSAVLQPPTSTIEVIAATTPSTTLAAYPWDLPSVFGPAQATVSAMPSVSSSAQAASTPDSVSTNIASVASPTLQPGIPTQKPSFVASLMSHVPQRTPTTLKTATIAPFQNSSSASSTAAAPTSSCSDVARFTIGFDDLPHFSTGPNDVDIPPIFNPYDKLYWEGNFGYVPPPSDPFPPVSPPQLAVYRVNNDTDVDGSPDAGDESIGEFGAGPRASDSAYWIDAFSVYLGCSNAGPDDCIITINGYVNSSSTREVSQTITQPPCPGLKNCTLAMVEFSEDFRGLSGIQILAAVNRHPVTWYMDDLQLGWSNRTCAAVNERGSHQ